VGMGPRLLVAATTVQTESAGPAQLIPVVMIPRLLHPDTCTAQASLPKQPSARPLAPGKPRVAVPAAWLLTVAVA